MDALILAGGKGTRLRSVVDDRPKVMAEVNGKPYLSYLFDQLLHADFERVILCVGYMADYIQAHYGHQYRSLDLVYSVEDSALGTGGAIRNALPHIKSDTVLVMNGDSYCDVSLKHYVQSHRSGVSLVLVHQDDTARYGRVEFDIDSQITRFIEKDHQSIAGWINAGIYLLDHQLIDTLPANTPLSIEQDVFPAWTEQRLLRAFYSQGQFIDIGIPESYAQATAFFNHVQGDLRRYVALDRDGTIIKQIHYLSRPDQVELLAGCTEGLQNLRDMGFGLVVVTNQSAIGRGYFDEAQLQRVHDRMTALLAGAGLALDGIYYCPAIPDDNSPDRKPNTGMLVRAATDFGFSLSACFVVGDKLSDVQLGHNVGATSFLVRTGYGSEVEQTEPLSNTYVTDDLLETSQIIAQIIADESA